MAKESTRLSRHEQASAAYLRGDYETAIKYQAELVEEHVAMGKQAITTRKLLALYLYSSRQFAPAIKLLKELEQEEPGDPEIPENIGVMLRQSGKHVEAIRYLLKAYEMDPAKFNVCDGLAHCFKTLNQPEEVQRFGRRSLELKDETTRNGTKWQVPEEGPPGFDSKKRQRNIISFSLFGSQPRYLHGALRNARLAGDLYPEWTCRFYCDPRVPRSVMDELSGLDCQIVERPLPESFYKGLLWRFEVIHDSSVDRFLVRDCDSVINIKERVAVDEWLASDRWFHLMRDYPSHTELILAGMWGGISGVLPRLEELMADFSPPTAATRTYDQHLLREMAWPTVRQSVLIHDSVYTGCLGSIPFPRVGQLPEGRHVGQNEAAVIDKTDLVFLGQNRVDELKRFFLLGMPEAGIDHAVTMLDRHPLCSCAPDCQLGAVGKGAGKWANDYVEILTASGNWNRSPDSEMLGEDLYRCFLDHLFTVGLSEGDTHSGVADTALDDRLELHEELFPEARFLFIVRDPRSVLDLRYQFLRKNRPGFDRDGSELNRLAMSVGTQWTRQLRNIQAFSRQSPGKIEMIRFEDLVRPAKRLDTLTRILDFLELDRGELSLQKIQEEAPGKENELAWKENLTPRAIGLLHQESARMMELLRYEPFVGEDDGNESDSGDTVLPS